MKPLTVTEIDAIVAKLKTLIGAQLQEVKLSGDKVILGLWHSSAGKQWLVIDLSPHSPVLIATSKVPFKLSAKANPVILFLRAHGRNKPLFRVERDIDLGRVVHFTLGSTDNNGCKLEVRLFPHGQNLLVRAGEKHVSWVRPKELQWQPANSSEPGGSRTIDEIESQWLEQFSKARSESKPGQVNDLEKQRQQKIKKLERAIDRVEKDLSLKKNTPWRELGQWLKREQTLDVPKVWSELVDHKQSLAANIEICFKKAKASEKKLSGNADRLAQLNGELEEWQQATEASLSRLLKKSGLQLKNSTEGHQSLLHKAQAKGRTLKVDENLVAFAGRSGPENLKLMRSARAWDLWFHVKDFPGRHGILHRNKGARVSDAQLQEVARWLLQLQFGDKQNLHQGESFDVIIAELRFVTPVKGDRAGRVTYRHERVMSVRI